MPGTFLHRYLPQGLDILAELASDLRWTWSHEGDQLWRIVNPEAWEKTRNPWLMLQSMSRVDFEKLSQNPEFEKELQELVETRQKYFNRRGWFKESYPEGSLSPVAYFSMEFGLGEALPLYAGGLGILAGDYLKTASDLQVPMIGIGLAYQEGYFRQMLDLNGWQMETYPYNDSISLPIHAAVDADGGWIRVSLELPGRVLWLRVWHVQVGFVSLYLLDSNDAFNTPVDRGITNKLYDSQPEIRLMQEMILGIGGWRILKALKIPVEVCHLNEGHPAFLVLERARDFMQEKGESFPVALCATRVGNVFTTHTPVAAGFDTFSADLISRYFQDYLQAAGIPLETVLAMGRVNPTDAEEPLNMAYLAMRCSIKVNGVSKLHGEVSRRIFTPLYPRWPEVEIPVDSITNGVHMPSWDSQSGDELWTKACGKERWLHSLEHINQAINGISDAELWELRSRKSQSLVVGIRRELTYQLRQHRTRPDKVKEAGKVLDPETLTIGFARRFTAYKRPNLILTDPDRLARILNNPQHPVQIIAAGKAHPRDEEGKRLIQQFVNFARRPDVRHRVVFLEDYDITTAQQLVQGVDLWLNTPRRPWEASGTSGMKVLVNGGLNLSELDGWWAEAYSPEVGWAIGDRQEHPEAGWDAVEANQLYELLEQKIVPEFYSRDTNGIPISWVAHIRASMSRLALAFSSNRMVREYVESVYIPNARLFRLRSENNWHLAKEIYAWQTKLEQHWSGIRFGELKVARAQEQWRFEASIYLGEIIPESIKVELYAEPWQTDKPVHFTMVRSETLGQPGGYVYQVDIPASRPIEDYTVRIIPAYASVSIPLEESHILWQR